MPLDTVDVEVKLADTTSRLGDTAIIFSCDQKFMPFAKGLVLSLIAAADHLNIFCINIGLSENSLTWLTERGVIVINFGWEELFPTSSTWRNSQYRLAQYVRPFLPRLISGFEYYIWLDADTWIQDKQALQTLRAAVHDNKNADIAIIPQVDFSYGVFLNQWGGPVSWSGHWYKNLYGETIAREFCNKAILNSGVFCMKGSSPIWKAWEIEIRSVLKKKIEDKLILHIAEQTCLNYLVYSYNNFIMVDPIYNYTLHDGCAKRVSESGMVVINYPPYRPISIIHLTSSSKYMQKYFDEGLLFECGTYLSEEERASLFALDHY